MSGPLVRGPEASRLRRPARTFSLGVAVRGRASFPAFSFWKEKGETWEQGFWYELNCIIKIHFRIRMRPRRSPMYSRPMDRIIAKWFVYVVIGLAVAYLWLHFEELRSAYRTLSADFWR